MYTHPVYYRGSAILLSFTLLFALIISGWDRIRFINGLFLMGISLLLIAAMIFIIRKGFFDLFVGGFKKVAQPQETLPFEEGSEPASMEKATWTRWIAPVCFTVGLIDTSLSFILL